MSRPIRMEQSTGDAGATQSSLIGGAVLLSINKYRPQNDKAVALLVERHVVDMIMTYHAPISECLALVRGLEQLQSAIFDLDRYGEDNWIIEQTTLDRIWKVIRRRASVFGRNFRIEESLEGLKLYQRMELDIRSGIDVDQLDIFDFYRAKCCDVKLARTIVATRLSRFSLSPFSSDSKYWDLYDLVSEVGDDLNDIEEDLNTYNGNRFLARCRNLGVAYALMEYRHFLLWCHETLVHYDEETIGCSLHQRTLCLARKEIQSLMSTLDDPSFRKIAGRSLSGKH